MVIIAIIIATRYSCQKIYKNQYFLTIWGAPKNRAVFLESND